MDYNLNICIGLLRFSLGLICIKPQVAHYVHSSTIREFKKVMYMALHLLLGICLLNPS